MKSLIVTTFNIRCFGFNGDYFAKNKKETRVPYLKDFLDKNYSKSDIIILQEIMDLSILSKILPKEFKVYSYRHDYQRHMHVVLCCRKELDFIDVQKIPNTTLDDTKSRPAFYGKLVKNNKELAHIVGVHLKSDYENTQNRVKQVKEVVKFLQLKNKNLPILIAGDFNSHRKEKTKKSQDDIEYINEVFKKLSLKRASVGQETYITLYDKAYLDHIWTNLEIKKSEVFKYQNFSEKPVKDYFNKISDHLPVTATLVIPT